MREFLKGLELDKETIDTIMAEHGKLITESKEEINSLKAQVKEYETKIEDLSSKADDNAKVQEELDNLKKSIAEENSKKEKIENEKILENNINSVLKDKKFVNEYTKTSIVNEIKAALNDKNNVGKSINDLFDEITKDKTGIYENPNQVINMGDNKNISDNVTSEAFEKMSYKQRIELKESNPELFAQLNK